LGGNELAAEYAAFAQNGEWYRAASSFIDADRLNMETKQILVVDGKFPDDTWIMIDRTQLDFSGIGYKVIKPGGGRAGLDTSNFPVIIQITEEGFEEMKDRIRAREHKHGTDEHLIDFIGEDLDRYLEVTGLKLQWLDEVDPVVREMLECFSYEPTDKEILLFRALSRAYGLLERSEAADEAYSALAIASFDWRNALTQHTWVDSEEVAEDNPQRIDWEY